MKILLNRSPRYNVAWGGGNGLLKAFVSRATELGHGIYYDRAVCPKPDVFFLMDPRPDDKHVSVAEIPDLRRRSPGLVVLHRINECDAKRGGGTMDSLLQETSRHVDVTAFVSEWMMDYHLSKEWHCDDCHVLINGVDRTVFRPRAEKISNANGKLNIVTHHWSDNELKGQRFYEWLDAFVARRSDRFTYTFIGRTHAAFANTRRIQPLPPEQLGTELARYDLCVNASVFDPGPNSTLESMACGLPTYVHADGGGSLEFAGSDHAFRTEDELEAILLRDMHYPNSMVPMGWDACIDAYLSIMSDRSLEDHDSSSFG